jgi:aspartyl-tRNA(Asn)/glutamyl-tRNA(Gln) amidotransferase subunit A
MSGDEIAWLTIRELGVLLRKREISAVELASICLERLDGIGRKLNAVVRLREDVAKREAALADAELRGGLDRGPLHGIPYGLKDIAASPGAPTTWGTPSLAEQTFDHEATVATRLRNAGAVLVAKLATIEFAGGLGYGHPNASSTGPAINPWHPTRWTHGSSSGPGAAVGAGLVPFAIGSDTSGSIILPASANGIAGLRPTYGLVSRYGAMTLSWTLDRLGPMCRTADDCGLVLEAVAGPDKRDPSSLPNGYQHGRDRRRAGFRIAVIEGGLENVQPDVVANFEKAVAALREFGTVETIAFPERPFGDALQIILAAEAYAAFDDFIAAGRTLEAVAAKAHGHRLAAAVIPAHDYIRAQRIRRIIAAEFAALAAHYDAIVAPSTFKVAFRNDEDFEPGHPRPWGKPLNAAGVLAGAPTLSIRSGLGEAGLPTGIQFNGAPHKDGLVIDVASVLEEHLSLSHLRPDLTPFL